MRKRFFDGHFALGLTLGLCLSTIFFMFAAQVQHTPNQYSQAEQSDGARESYQQEDRNYTESTWWHWDGGLVSSRDTLAQWVIAFLGLVAVALSAIAVYFVWKTLTATRQLAGDTRAIGDMQNRAWLKCGLTFPSGLLASKDSLPFGMKLEIENIGKSPAVDVLSDVFLFQSFAHDDEAKISHMMHELIERIEINHERPGVILPGETYFHSRAEPLRVDEAKVLPVIGVIPVACVVTVYRITSDDDWHCTATIFDIFVKPADGIGLGYPFPMDGKALPGNSLNVVMRRTAIAT